MEEIGHLFLQRNVNSAVDFKVKPIQIVEIGNAESLHHGGSDRIGCFVLDRRGLRRQRRRGQELDRCLLQRRGEFPIDETGARHQPGKLVHFLVQRGSLFDQEDRWRSH